MSHIFRYVTSGIVGDYEDCYLVQYEAVYIRGDVIITKKQIIYTLLLNGVTPRKAQLAINFQM